MLIKDETDMKISAFFTLCFLVLPGFLDEGNKDEGNKVCTCTYVSHIDEKT